MEAAHFRPTWHQALGRALILGALGAVVLLATALVVGVAWLWPLLVFGPPVTAVFAAELLRRRVGTEITAAGIRTVTPFGAGTQPWSQVVDLRAERRGARTVVSVYLNSGTSVQLRAPYSGEFFAADPRFEQKVSALAHLWRSHRFGGVPT
ncbi:PH domain-containing protein [Actinoplanes sp. TFC3]|uniref:PH domain-containing protein n=1 Tax=Actinoplanes sp. TFC3 TaxID=1710355 RepID=UPI00082C3973|nr:PH domain-containing protein [Actinoplanes sp. TFC3]